MKTLARIIAVTLLVMSFSVTIYAQTAVWEDLMLQSDDLYQQGRYSEAAKVALEALINVQDKYALDHPNVATCLFRLAKIYEAQGKYGKAEDYYKRSLATYEKSSRPDHPDVNVATCLFRLAEINRALDKYSEAEDFYNRSLSAYEKGFWRDYPIVATVLNSLAELYKDQKKYGEAENCYKRVLAIRKKVYGHNDPLVVQSLNSLAEIYEAQGKYAEAEFYYKQAAATTQEASGNAKGDKSLGITVIIGGVLVLLMTLSVFLMFYVSGREDSKLFTEYAESMGLSYTRKVPDGVSGFSSFRSLFFQDWDYFEHVIYGKTESLGVAIFTCTGKADSQRDSRHRLTLLLESDQLRLPSSFENLPSFKVRGSGEQILVCGKILYVRPDHQDYKSLLEKILQALQVSLK